MANISPGARTALQGAMARYQPGGGFGAGIEAGLERGRVKALASGMQNLVSAGLAGTTIAGGLGKKYEAEVAAPTRARVEDIRTERLSALQTILAQMEQAGHEAGLSRAFQAAQSKLTRKFQAEQAAAGRQLSAWQTKRATPAAAPTTMPTMRAPAAAPITGAYIAASKPQWGAGMTQAAAPTPTRVPGSYVGTMNGTRYEYNQQGVPVRSALSPRTIGSAITAAMM